MDKSRITTNKHIWILKTSLFNSLCYRKSETTPFVVCFCSVKVFESILHEYTTVTETESNVRYSTYNIHNWPSERLKQSTLKPYLLTCCALHWRAFWSKSNCVSLLSHLRRHASAFEYHCSASADIILLLYEINHWKIKLEQFRHATPWHSRFPTILVSFSEPLASSCCSVSKMLELKHVSKAERRTIDLTSVPSDSGCCFLVLCFEISACFHFSGWTSWEISKVVSCCNNVWAAEIKIQNSS